MGVIVTQNPEDLAEFTLTVHNDHEGSVFVDLGESLAELVINDDALIATEEITLNAESKVELLAEYMEYLKNCIHDGYVHTLLQCGKIVKNSIAHELFVLGHVSSVLKMPKIEFVSAKWWDDPKYEAEVVVRIT